MRISIVGFGLIGGSIARALRSLNGPAAWHVTAWSRNPAPVKLGLADGVIDVAATRLEEAVADADLIVLAAPPLVCVELLDRLGADLSRFLPDDATVTDVASAKAGIVARADRARLHFIGGHPMAGREVSGYAASMADLFIGRPWVTVRGQCARLGDGERVGELVSACGAIQIPMGSAAHDRAVAAISHLPLVLSAALVETIAGRPGEPDRGDWKAAEVLAATGWAGMTRLAKGEPAMGAGIAATNSAAIAERLREFRSVLDEWLAELEAPSGPDALRLQKRFAADRARLEKPASD